MCCQKSSCTVRRFHVLSEEFMYCQKISCTVRRFHVLSEEFMYCKNCQSACIVTSSCIVTISCTHISSCTVTLSHVVERPHVFKARRGRQRFSERFERAFKIRKQSTIVRGRRATAEKRRGTGTRLLANLAEEDMWEPGSSEISI